MNYTGVIRQASQGFGRLHPGGEVDPMVVAHNSTNDEPAPPEVFERPDVKEGIEEALREANENRADDGITAEEVLDMARDRRGVDSKR